MSSTVVENTENPAERLEIVLRDPFMNLQQIKIGFFAVVLLYLAPVVYKLLEILNDTTFSRSGTILL